MSIAEKIIRDIDNKIDNWNERSMFTIKGVKNLSMADLDTIKLYAQTYARYESFDGLMQPRGSVKEVLQAYGLID